MPATTARDAPEPDAMACPLCGKANQCAMEIGKSTGTAQGECWCVQVKFSEDVLARVPEPAIRLACICRACAMAGSAVHNVGRLG